MRASELAFVEEFRDDDPVYDRSTRQHRCIRRHEAKSLLSQVAGRRLLARARSRRAS